MDAIVDSYAEAELALAAYSDLADGVRPDIAALMQNGKGFSYEQAAAFADNWLVVKQFNDPVTGCSATVFENAIDHTRHLAIRGTEGAADVAADYYILNGTPSTLNPQYLALKAKVQQWLSDGTLDSVFTVSGHSLGGYLAAGLLADFGSNISHAYLYNAPGNNSPLGQLLQALGVFNSPDISKITNIRADAGISPIAGLGCDIAPPTRVVIENQMLDDVASPPAAMNHS